ncbi:MAG: ABC transporter ATP-binding protein [Bifidobacteriaceae bacterium]|nr:ABC transporter ATP-binding protein [Bifidobacteriaceae bacterium]
MSSIETKAVTRVFQAGEQEIRAVDQASFGIDDGQLTLILGPSGSGKTTILNLLGGMDSPTSGAIMVDGSDLATASEEQLTSYRRDHVGFVFQFYNLISSLTAAENIALGSQFAQDRIDPRQALAEVGLENRGDSFPFQLSGGEMQRVAIARALAKRPRLLLCDEPTGALDSETGASVLAVLRDLAKDPARAVVIVTHNEALTGAADKIIRVSNGKIASVVEREQWNW